MGMRVVVIDDDGKIHQAKAGVAIVADDKTNVPVAMARYVNDQIEFVSVETPTEFVGRLQEVMTIERIAQLFILPKHVFELPEGQEKIRKVT